MFSLVKLVTVFWRKCDRGFNLQNEIKFRRSQSSSRETIYEEPYAGSNESTEYDEKWPTTWPASILYVKDSSCEPPTDTETRPIIKEHPKSIANNKSKINWHIVKEIICIILGIIGVLSLATIGFHLFKSLSVSCADGECLDADCTDSCTLWDNATIFFR